PWLCDVRDSSQELGFAFSCQPTAKPADLDSRAVGIVVGRNVNLDVSGVGGGLASDETGTDNDKNDDDVALHFSLTNRKLNHRFSGRNSQSVCVKNLTTGAFDRK